MSQNNDIVIDPSITSQDQMQHHRQQLSAMADGALAPDQARFLLRRLQHDAELASCWERWQVYGDAMRGHAHALLPADFAQRVGQAIAADAALVAAATAPVARRGVKPWQWFGGGALAASLALFAVLGLRPDAAPTPVQASADVPSVKAPVADAVPAAPVLDTPVQVAQTPSPEASTPIAPRQSNSPATPAPRNVDSRVRTASAPVAAPIREAATLPALPSVPVDSSSTAAVLAAADAAQADPFAVPQAAPVARPWPRAVLPGASQGAFNASFGGAGFTPAPAPRELPATSVQDAPAQ